MNKIQLRELITHVLKRYNLYSDNAVELLMLTVAIESNLGHYIKQVGNGPALGIFQCEPNTYDWVQTKTMEKYEKWANALDEKCKEVACICLDEYLSSAKHIRTIRKSKEWKEYWKWRKIDDQMLLVLNSDAERFDFMCNLELQILSCRLVYWFKSANPIPNHKDIEGLAEYWKKYYNSYLGAGTIEGAIEKYNKYVKA